MYNIDETSLLIKNVFSPACLYNKKLAEPTLTPPNLIFSTTAVLIVDGGGGHCQSTLILNDRVDLSLLKNYVNKEVDIKFILYMYVFCIITLKNFKFWVDK
jgi:hypothetical protein